MKHIVSNLNDYLNFWAYLKTYFPMLLCTYDEDKIDIDVDQFCIVVACCSLFPLRLSFPCPYALLSDCPPGCSLRVCTWRVSQCSSTSAIELRENHPTQLELQWLPTNHFWGLILYHRVQHWSTHLILQPLAYGCFSPLRPHVVFALVMSVVKSSCSDGFSLNSMLLFLWKLN